MRKFCIGFLLGVLVLCPRFFAERLTAQTNEADVGYPVVVSIGGRSPDMTVQLYRMIPESEDALRPTTAENEKSLLAMNFESWSLLQAGPGLPEQWVSKDIYVAFIQATGYGVAYKVTSTFLGELSNGVDRLPRGSFACIPVINDELPLGARIGEPGPAMEQVGTSSTRLIYASDPLGQSSDIGIRYGFLPYNSDGSAPYSENLYLPIPASQSPGTYAGATVTIDIAPVGT